MFTLFTIGVLVFMAGFLIGKVSQPLGDYICIAGAILTLLFILIRQAIL